ncbi:Zn(II)2Cys6 transcription factor domain-containing protein [Aspergillus stella-maris]|uniref:Zn(II)2Cys6 transcription factor domain-containing protein n=1 Tax=Aspergillus stella-maris TaxID=1810926 RepID=UPI003CCC92B3
MNVPTTAEPGQGQPQPLTAGDMGSSPGRGKTVTSACERCRRRKIRCDGDTPCSTCRRFRIQCVRIQKHDTHALEQRVRELEARIAEFSSGRSNGESLDVTPLLSPQPWTPDIQLSSDFGSPGPALSMEQSFSHSNQLSPLDIPSIQVVDYADNTSPVSPVSPVSLSTSPIFRALAPAPATSRPDIDTLRPPGTAAISPPMSACASPNNGLMSYLSPRSMPGPSRSRSSSISSLGLDNDWSSAPGDFSAFGLSDIELDTSIFDMSPNSPDIEAPRAPTRFEAETVLDKFFDRMQSARYPLPPYPLARSRLFQFLDIVDQNQLSPVREYICPTSMARFHVYMAMACGLRMDPEGSKIKGNMLWNCYRLAMDESRDPSFWKQAFSLEAAILIMIFAQVSGQTA